MSKRIAVEKNVDIGSKKDVYNLRLVQNSEKDYTVFIEMNILFNFVGRVGKDGKEILDEKGNPETTWNNREKFVFLQQWKHSVRSKWVAKRFYEFDGNFVSVDLDFNFKIGTTYPESHWQILVQKLREKEEFSVSYVWRDQLPGKFDVLLDSLDNKKKTSIGDKMQTGAAHEFGHMIGLGDEYGEHGTEATKKDTHSIMNSGSKIRKRHYSHVMGWAEKRIDKWKEYLEGVNKAKKPGQRIMYGAPL